MECFRGYTLVTKDENRAVTCSSGFAEEMTVFSMEDVAVISNEGYEEWRVAKVRVILDEGGNTKEEVYKKLLKEVLETLDCRCDMCCKLLKDIKDALQGE